MHTLLHPMIKLGQAATVLKPHEEDDNGVTEGCLFMYLRHIQTYIKMGEYWQRSIKKRLICKQSIYKKTLSVWMSINGIISGTWLASTGGGRA